MNTIQTIHVKSGSTLGYVDIGQGLPIVLIHGLFLDHTAFESQIQAFADRYRIIAIDIHGHDTSANSTSSVDSSKVAVLTLTLPRLLLLLRLKLSSSDD